MSALRICEVMLWRGPYGALPSPRRGPRLDLASSDGIPNRTNFRSARVGGDQVADRSAPLPVPTVFPMLLVFHILIHSTPPGPVLAGCLRKGMLNPSFGSTGLEVRMASMC